jgi:hypothetical protein
MDFLGKPKWYGVPVLVRSNLPLLIRVFAIFIAIASIIAIVAAGLNWKSPDNRLLFPAQAFVASLTIITFAIGWFVAVFFFFRLFVNAIRMNFNRSDGAKFWSAKAFYLPIYGWRSIDLSDEGIRLRRLAIEGLIGFLAVNGLIWLLVFASKAVGVDLQDG